MRAHTAGDTDDGPMTTTVPASVLVVEDEKDLAAMLASYLQRAGFAVELAHTGPAALELARQINPGVIVLDLGLPGLDGFEVCRRLRTFTDCYVLMLTARTDEIDTVVGLSVGADDYITKPFSPRELVARIGAVLRRPRTPAGPSESDGGGRRVFGGLLVDLAGRRVQVDGAPIDLTRTEFDILALLASSPSVAFSRRRIINEVWNQSWVGDEHVVDVHVAHLRRKLGDDPGTPRYVDTVRGVGYRMVQP